MSTILQGLVTAITTAYGAMLTALPSNIASAVKSLLIVTNGTTDELSAFGLVIAIFAGVALAWATIRFVFGMVRGTISHN